MLQNDNTGSIPAQNTENIKKTEDEEISLIDLFAVLWKRRFMIIGITVTAMLLVVIACIVSIKMDPKKSFMPNEYEVSAKMLIKKDNANSSSLSSSLGSLGSMAGLLGMNIKEDQSTSQLIMYLIKSDLFLDAVVKEFKIIEKNKIKKSPIATSRKAIKDLVKAEFESGAGVLTIKVKDIDTQFAYDVVNFSVNWIADKLEELGVDNNRIQKANLEKNLDLTWEKIQKLSYELNNLTKGIANGKQLWTMETTLEQYRIEMEIAAQKEVYTQLKGQLELLKITMQTDTPVFQIIEKPLIPDLKCGPARSKLCIIVSMAAFFISVFLAFLLNAIENIKNDPEVMAKLKNAK